VTREYSSSTMTMNCIVALRHKTAARQTVYSILSHFRSIFNYDCTLCESVSKMSLICLVNCYNFDIPVHKLILTAIFGRNAIASVSNQKMVDFSTSSPKITSKIAAP